MEKETLEERIQYIAFLHKQNLNGRETEDELFEEGILAGIEETEEIMYSEEDVKYAYEQGARLALLSQSPLALHKGEFPNPKEWFNDFKKDK